MKQLTGLALSTYLWLFLSGMAHAVVIDDFSIGAYDATVPNGLWLDPLLQNNLDPAHVVGGTRTISFGAYGFPSTLPGSVHISIDPTNGAFESAADPGLTPANLYVRYGQGRPMDVNMKAGGANALIFDFASADFGDNYFHNVGYFDIGLSSGQGQQLAGGGVFAGVFDSPTPFSMAIPLSYFESPSPGLDLTHVSGISFGTGNGNLFGTFKLDAVRTAFVPPGDFNIDGVVDDADYAVWKSQFGDSAYEINEPADANRDGFIDAADYTIWRDNAITSGPAAGNAAPEPSTGLLVFLGLGCLAWKSGTVIAARRRFVGGCFAGTDC